MVRALLDFCAAALSALYCDVRFVARGARFTTAFSRRGLAGEFGITWLLPKLIGLERASDLLLSGRVFEADEALALGLVSRVVEPDELLAVTRAYAADVAANCSPLSMALLRAQLHGDLQSDFSAALVTTYRAMAHAAVAPDFREGVSSFLEKRSPQFPPLAADLDPYEVTGGPSGETSFDPGSH